MDYHLPRPMNSGNMVAADCDQGENIELADMGWVPVDDIRGTRVVGMAGSGTEEGAWRSCTARENYYKGYVEGQMQTGQAKDGRER